MKKKLLYTYAAVLVIAICISYFGALRYAYEVQSVRLFPDAGRAFAYGERYFNAKNRNDYNIDRAEYFFGKAADIDVTTPYLFHELARIAFLKGDFEVAMALINSQIDLMGDSAPNSYYIRALIEGYKGDYVASAEDYKYFLKFQPTNWAAVNDYAWVLLKAGKAKEASDATARALEWFPENPWLLNTHATARYELHDYEGALLSAQKASVEVATLSEAEWLQAYPGNDPKIADRGIVAFQKAVRDNIHSITSAVATSAVQSTVQP